MTESTLKDDGFERALLALILADNAVLNRVARLRPDDFADPARGIIFETMSGLREENRPINPVTLGALFGSDPLSGGNLLDDLRAVSFGDSQPKPEDLADALIDLSERRRLCEQGKWLAEQCQSTHARLPDLLATFSGELDAVVNRLAGSKDDCFEFSAAMEATIAELQSPSEDERIPSRIADLDRRTGGFRRRHLTVIASRPSMGKSTLAVCLATNAALGGHGVLVFSMEMGRDDWMVRVASEATFANGNGLPYANALRGDLRPEAMESFIEAGRSRKHLPVVVDFNQGLTITEIAARIRRVSESFLRDGRRLGLVIIDHLSKIAPSKDYRGRRDLEVGQITNSLTQIAKSADVSVICLHQLNRELESGADDAEEMGGKRPKLSHLRDSGRIEEDADNVILLFRPEYYLERQHFDKPERETSRLLLLERKKNILELNIAKFRQGQTGIVEVFCDVSCNVVRNLERNHR